MYMCVHHEITAHVLTVDSVTIGRDAVTHMTPDVPGLIGVSTEDHGASQQQAVQVWG